MNMYQISGYEYKDSMTLVQRYIIQDDFLASDSHTEPPQTQTSPAEHIYRLCPLPLLNLFVKLDALAMWRCGEVTEVRIGNGALVVERETTEVTKAIKKRMGMEAHSPDKI
jgi:hypothetical protein